MGIITDRAPPASVQEAIDLMGLAFDLADRYRHLVFLIADGLIGQMMELAELPPMRLLRKVNGDWVLTGAGGRALRVITSLQLGAQEMEAVNLR